MLRYLFLSIFLSLLGSCDLIPSRNASKNADLYREVLIELQRLEASGAIDADTPSVVIVNRYGTSFGATIALAGYGADGHPLSAEEMTEYCLQRVAQPRLRHVKACLRENFTSNDALRFSHGGLAYKVPGRPWQVRQSLRAIETTEHFQWFGSLERFIDIPLVEHRIQILVPDIALQDRLVQSLLVENGGERLIDPVYNLVAKPFQTEEQMSNQFIMELVASAMHPQDWPISRVSSQHYLQQNGFQPTVILLGGIQSLTKLDRLFGTIDLSDQPHARRYEIGELITTLSMEQFLQRSGRLAAIREVTL